MTDRATARGGIGLAGLTFLVLLTLKLTVSPDIPWFWVFFPLWIWIAVVVGILVLLVLCFLVYLVWLAWEERPRPTNTNWRKGW